MRAALPPWIAYGLVPALNLLLAAVVTGLAIWAIGQDPFQALRTLVVGAVGDGDSISHSYAIGYTLFYATDFIFTGLAFAIALQVGQFNIGAEGQLAIGGLALGIVVLQFGFLPAFLLVPLAVLAAAAGGAAWAAIPGIMYVKRQSHIVITTIMMNFIAASVSVYFVVQVFSVAGTGATESAPFDAKAIVASFASLLGLVGLKIDDSPGNVSFVIALAAVAATWLLLYRSRFGYDLRTAGTNADAARYAGINLSRTILVSLLLSGAAAGLVGVNELMGFNGKLILGFAAGFGFGGIAVAMMGRCHPVGIVIAALLFGGLVQGGAELSFEMPGIRREMVVAIQGFVIYFTSATEYLFSDYIIRLITFFNSRKGSRTTASRVEP